MFRPEMVALFAFAAGFLVAFFITWPVARRVADEDHYARGMKDGVNAVENPNTHAAAWIRSEYPEYFAQLDRATPEEIDELFGPRPVQR